MTSLMVMLKMVMQMKSMTLRAGRRWGISLAKSYRKKRQRSQRNALRRSRRRRPAAGTSCFLHRDVNYILQIEGFWLICSKCWNPGVFFLPVVITHFNLMGELLNHELWKETAHVLAYKKVFLKSNSNLICHPHVAQLCFCMSNTCISHWQCTGPTLVDLYFFWNRIVATLNLHDSVEVESKCLSVTEIKVKQH